MASQRLQFEKEICELEDLLAKLEADGGSSEEIRRMRRELLSIIKKKYSNLTPWETVQVARCGERPQTVDYIDLMFDEFVGLHGDRGIGDARALRTGFAR